MEVMHQELCREFMSELAITNESSRTYHYALAMYVDFLEGRGVALPEASPRDVDDFAARIWRIHRATLAQVVFGIVKRLHRWLAENGVAPDVARKCAPPERAMRYIRLELVVEQAQAMLLAAGAGRDGAIASLMVRAAMKTGDLAGMRVGDVLVTPDGSEVRTRDGEWVPVTAECARALSGYLEQMGRAAEHPSEPLFPSHSTRTWGEPLAQRSIRGIVNEICLKAGVPGGANEYNIGSAALALAIDEGEPLEVILSLSDRTWLYRMNDRGRTAGRFLR